MEEQDNRAIKPIYQIQSVGHGKIDCYVDGLNLIDFYRSPDGRYVDSQGQVHLPVKGSQMLCGSCREKGQ